MGIVRGVYDRLPRRYQLPLSKVYRRTAYRLERRLAHELLERGVVPPLDRASLASDPAVDTWPVGEAETYTFDPPVVSGYVDVVRRRIEERARDRPDIVSVQDGREPPFTYTVESGPSFVAELRDVTLFGPSALVRTADGAVPLDVMSNRVDGVAGLLHNTFRRMGRVDAARFLLGDSPRPRSEFEVATSLVHGYRKPPAYAHWLLERLPRLRGIEQYVEATGREPTVLVDRQTPEWQRELLRLAGVEDERTQVWEGGVASVDRFVLPTMKDFGSLSEPDEPGYRWIRDRLLSNVEYERHTDQFADRLFLSRERMERRHVLNRGAVTDALADYGFEVVCPETLSIPEQVGLFAGADVVVSPHGSALTNVVFGTNLDVVELYSSHYFGTDFFELAVLFGHEYRPVFGVEEEWSHPHMGPAHQDMRIDVDQLRAAVEGTLET